MAQADSIPRTVTLSSGQTMPTLGLGTFSLKDAEKHPQIIYDAIVKSDYRLLDCATCYGNEEIVGQSLKRAISEGAVAREDMFVVTKLWMSDFKDPETALRTSLGKLQVEYVDLYLIHWPAGFWQQDPANRVPIHILWRKLEELVDAGLIKSIGVSNFNLQMLADLLCYARHKPTCNEVELNPTVSQDELVRFMLAQNIVPIAYTPVARIGEVANADLFQNQTFVAICERHGKSQAQVMLNWAVARGTIPIPRSGSSPHIHENISIYDFKLTQEEMDQISALNSNTRICDKFGIVGGYQFFV